MSDLVIVESPAKAKTIEKYLGSNYKVIASMGHLRDLPKSRLGVDLENGFRPEYIAVKDKHDLIKKLKQAVKEADIVYLATDPDREGEAISWHLKELLDIDDDRARRVTFNEITKKVVTESIKAPRDIDQNLVDAQQARRVLDRIVGYQLSPLLWRKVKRGLSAGRVQSVATRMVTDREDEINAFVSEEYWLLDVLLDHKGTQLSASYYGTDGEKRKIRTEEEVKAVISDVEGRDFTVDSVKKAKKERSPAPPFTTSTLQQEASRRLNMTPRRTMTIAQQLYEGVEISSRGSLGLITYMRTDSLRLSAEALAAAKSFINDKYGSEYYPPVTRVYKTKQGAQDAHEAIRPTDIYLTPELVKKDLTREQFMLYRLIWCRFAACQMANAVYDSVTAEFSCARHNFQTTCSTLRFPGYTAVYEELKDDDSKENINHKNLPELAEGTALAYVQAEPKQQFTQPPTRYTEATLIRAMEEKGIGRPSTYAPTITTILSHDYVIKEGKYLKPTPLGEIVTGLMKEHFPDIVDVKFTNEMEQKLDGVESGEAIWTDVLDKFYKAFSTEFENAETNLNGVRVKVPDVESKEVCPVCGRNLVVKKGRFGYFLACPGFPECTFTMPMVEEMPGKCPKCGSRIFKRKSSKGYVFYACENKEGCGFMSWDVPTKDVCPECGKTMFKPSGRGPLKSFCINEECPKFVPEEKRRYQKKKPAEKKEETEKTAGAKKSAGDKKTAGKKSASAGKSSAAKKTASSGKSSSTKKAASGKSAASKKSTSEKTEDNNS